MVFNRFILGTFLGSVLVVSALVLTFMLSPLFSDNAAAQAVGKKRAFLTGASVWSSPAIGSDGTIYVGSYDNKLYAINSDGTEKWAFTTAHDVLSSPAIVSDGTIYVGSNDNKLYAINPDGTEKSAFSTGGSVWSSPAVGSDGTIYVGSWDDSFYALYEVVVGVPTIKLLLLDD